MPLEQKLNQKQILTLTQSMQQSLKILQLPILELQSFLQEQALSNPLLDVEEPALQSLTPEAIELREKREDEWVGRPSARANAPDGEPQADFTAFSSRPELFSEYLERQIGQIELPDGAMRTRCLYLVGCLNDAGYLDCPLPELARELHCSLFDMEQALYVIQELDPPGTGARTLSECLLLQLVHSHHFTEINIRLVQDYLPLLAHCQGKQLARALHASPEETERAVQTIRSLNPIPSSGYCTENTVQYALPEASIRVEGGRILVEMNEQLLPRVTLTPAYCAMLDRPEYQEVHPYLREKSAEAKGVITGLKNRSETLHRILTAVAARQADALAHGAPLRPMSMRDLAEELGLNVSTISRAAREKYIQFNGSIIPLRSLFTAALSAPDGEAVSSNSAKHNLKSFIAAEDPHKPLSDDALCRALAGVGIQISRRTVAKYRGELQIPSTRQRKR